MFIGHFAVGMGAKSIAQKTSLGTLFLAAQFIDLLWPIFLLLGLESVEIENGITVVTPLNFISYPISHSLLMVLGWGLLFAIIYHGIQKYTTGALIVGILVISHWFLDLLVHRPDLPLYPGDSPLLGLGVWNSIVGTILLEGILFIIGIIIYLNTTEAKNKRGLYGFWGLICFLLLINISNLMSPPPPDVNIIAWVGNLQWLIIIWAYWIDKNRIVKGDKEHKVVLNQRLKSSQIN